jgi:hypothetical protein
MCSHAWFHLGWYVEEKIPAVQNPELRVGGDANASEYNK